MKIYKTTNEAYLATLQDVFETPEYVSAPRGQFIREKLDYTFRVLEPCSNSIVTKDLKRNKLIADYTSKEMALYKSCSNNVDDFAKASKFWNTIANPDDTINSAYGYLIWKNKSCGSDFEVKYIDIPCFSYNEEDSLMGFTGGSVKSSVSVRRTPWEWAKQCLIDDKDTRQAIMRFSLPQHQWIGNKDQTCTMHANWLIRDNKLHLSVVMRSNDLNKGLVYDLPWFCGLMDQMVDELKPSYPALSKGHYTHTVHSIHIYERDCETVLKMLGHGV
jgi:hypothetical protein